MAIKALLSAQENSPLGLEKWLKKREDIIRRFKENIGTPEIPRNTREIEMLETTQCDKYKRHKIRYIVGDNEEIRAYLLVPNEAPVLAPAIVAMHQTNDYGKDEVAGINGYRDFAYGHELATRGYIVLAPDCLTAGERVYPGKSRFDSNPFYEKYPNWSMVGKDIEDSMAAVDVLFSLDNVNMNRIGVIGHSHGGSNAIFAMALDDRVSVGVSNCGMSVISEEEKRLEWSAEEGYIYFPTLRKFLLQGKELPFDIHEVAALIAPRPWLNISAYHDRTLGNQEFLAEVGIQFNHVYRLYERQNHFSYFMHGNDHSFPKYARVLAYEWMDKFMKS